jgi:hypothetical protein
MSILYKCREQSKIKQKTAIKSRRTFTGIGTANKKQYGTIGKTFAKQLP